jgi:hypothetical protein
MKVDGLQRMLDFLNLLADKGIHFYVEQNAPDSMRVTATLVSVRLEVAFFVNEMQFSVFRGNEDVEVDEKLLRQIMEENWDM